MKYELPEGYFTPYRKRKKYSKLNRHTMGQDWGGRRGDNPPECPYVTGDQVRAYAKSIGVEVKREGLGMWFRKIDEKWYTLGMTNYIALGQLFRFPNGGLIEKGLE